MLKWTDLLLFYFPLYSSPYCAAREHIIWNCFSLRPWGKYCMSLNLAKCLSVVKPIYDFGHVGNALLVVISVCGNALYTDSQFSVFLYLWALNGNFWSSTSFKDVKCFDLSTSLPLFQQIAKMLLTSDVCSVPPPSQTILGRILYFCLNQAPLPFLPFCYQLTYLNVNI